MFQGINSSTSDYKGICTSPSRNTVLLRKPACYIPLAGQAQEAVTWHH